jgi:hypothetical protein
MEADEAINEVGEVVAIKLKEWEDEATVKCNSSKLSGLVKISKVQ